MWISYRQRNITSWSKKNDRTSLVHIFSFRKSFWKTKRIEEQGEKQIKAVENNKKQLHNKKQVGNNELLLLKEKNI